MYPSEDHMHGVINHDNQRHYDNIKHIAMQVFDYIIHDTSNSM